MEKPHISKKEAEELDYFVLCGPYSPRSKREKGWLSTVLHDLRSADYALVDVPGGTEVWRHKSEMDLYAKTERMTRYKY